MDVGTNKTRKDTRAVVSLVARYRSPSTFEYVEEACCDVSLGGMFIRSKDPAAAGTLLKLECESGDGEHIRGVARVVWLRAQSNEYGPSGMGVKFVKLDPESRDLITRLVQELAEAGIETLSMSSAPELRGKPPSKRPGSASSTPAAAEPPPPPPPKAAELSATRPLSSNAPRNDVAALHRASDRAAGTPPPPPPSSSKPPGMSSRPAPSNALLAHAKVEPIEIESSSSGSALAPLQELGRDLAPPQEIGRDLAPLQAMVRSSRVSSAPPHEERNGRAFWLVAGAVLALGAIVTLLSMRAAREPDGEPQANGGSTPTAQAPSPTSPTAMNRADRAPSEATEAKGAEGASALSNRPDQGAELAAEQAPAEQFADPELVAAAIPSDAPSEPAQVPVAAPTEPTQPTQAEQTAQRAQPAAASEGTAAPPTSAQPNAAAPTQANARPSASDSQPSAAAPTQANPRPSAAAPTNTPPAPASAPTRSAMADVPPVVRIVPNDQAQASASSSTPPSAANPSAAPAAPARAPKESAAPSSSTAAATTQNKVEPPPLPPGEIARVITFTSRPLGASIFVGDQTVTTPGELNLGAMPPRIRVTAQKEGFESSTVWINNTAEFQKVGGVMRREVHFVLRALPAAAQGAPGQPQSAAPVQPPAATATATPTQGATAAPSQP